MFTFFRELRQHLAIEFIKKPRRKSYPGFNEDLKEFAHVLVNKIFSFLFSFGYLPFKREYCTVKSSRKVSMNPLLHERLQLWCPAFLFMNFCYVTLLRRVFILLQILQTNCSSSTIEYTFFLRLLQPLCCDLRSR